MPPLVLLQTSPRVAPGLLSAPAWRALRSLPVACAAPGPLVEVLLAEGIEVALGAELPTGPPVAGGAQARGLVWLIDAGDPSEVAAVARLAAVPGVELLVGSHDLPGARLLDAVAVMDRLRSPGGCPWDAAQTPATLAAYLLEEAYEAYAALEDLIAGRDDGSELRDELGDVLLQVLFHARLAQESPGGWGIDDVAAGLVEKLVRRHPHVFADVSVEGAADVVVNWDAIKATEKPRRGVVEGVPLALPALALTAKLVRRARKAGTPVEYADASAALRALEAEPAPATLAALLLAVVGRADQAGLDAEEALRGRARLLYDELSGAGA